MPRTIEWKFILKRKSYWWISDFLKKENILITEIDNCLNCYLGTRLGDLEKINWC